MIAILSQQLLTPTTGSAILTLITLISVLFCGRRRRHVHPLPPGPKGWPFIGNVLQMPKQHNWLTFASWAKTYGDVVYIRAFSRQIIILNSHKAVNDLMIHRSNLYSDRPRRVMGELSGFSQGLLFVDCGEQWRKLRRLVHEEITGHHAAKYHYLQEEEIQAYVLQLLNEPERFMEHVRRFAGSVILRITHGYSVALENDPLISLAEELTKIAAMIMTHGLFIIEAVPSLIHFPAWTPFFGRFRRIASGWRKTLEEFKNVPHNFVKDNLARGLASESFTSNRLQSKDDPATEEEEEVIKIAAASLYAGGTDTTVSVATSFFLAMALNPDIQKKAQAEIDSIVGAERLPALKDRPLLPYISCIAQECLRWNPVAPLVTHCTQKEDIYQGYRIPAGTAVVANVWSITHDETVYPDPLRFYPDRFLNTSGTTDETTKSKNPRYSVFGFGKRVCPGMDIAEDSLWILVATTLAAFTIGKALDSEGREIQPQVRYTSNSLCHPEKFPCKVSPRSAASKELLQSFV